MARLTALGHEVVLLYLNDGAWPPTPANIRTAEATKACGISKARPAYAGQTNGHAVVDPTHYDDCQKVIAAENPDAVFTHWPIDNHPDHRAIFMLTYNAWRKLNKKFALYYYEVSDGEDTLQFSPNRYVDITDTEPRKRASCYAHASQTPERYYELQDSVARFRGSESGYRRQRRFCGNCKSVRHISNHGKLRNDVTAVRLQIRNNSDQRRVIRPSITPISEVPSNENQRPRYYRLGFLPHLRSDARSDLSVLFVRAGAIKASPWSGPRDSSLMAAEPRPTAKFVSDNPICLECQSASGIAVLPQRPFRVHIREGREIEHCWPPPK